MEKRYFLRLSVILLAVGFILAGCDDGALFNRITDPPPDPIVLTGSIDGGMVTVAVSQTNISTALLAMRGGDYYEIWLAGELVSKGRVIVNGSIWTFTPFFNSPGTKTTFKATYNDGTLSNITVPGTGISNAQVSKDGDPPGNNGNNGDNGNNGNNGNDNVKPALTGTVTIDNKFPEVGDTLIATYRSGNGSGTATWQWLRNNTPASSSNSRYYYVTPDDEGVVLRARVSFTNQEGIVTSTATAVVLLPYNERPTLTGTVTVNNTSPEIGDTVTATYRGGNGVDDPIWQWLRGGEPIYGANRRTYTVKTADAGMTIRAQVSFTERKGYITSVATAAVPDTRPVLTGTVTINDTSPRIGNTLTATYTGGNGTGTAVWQWLRWDVPIDGTNSRNYTVVEADANAILKARVRYEDQRNTVTSMGTEEVFVPVTGIADVAKNGTAGTAIALNGTVLPVIATNQDIEWTIKDARTTGASISGNILNTTGTGTVTVTATIANGTASGAYRRDFSIAIGAATAAGYDNQGLYYYPIKNNTEYRVSGPTVISGNVVIPAAFNGLPVTEIGNVNDTTLNGAFSNTGIRSIIIPSTVTSIGANAFYGCTSLDSIAIPESVKIIGSSAFGFCSKLDSITIPASVTSIGESVFTNCTSLTSVTINANITSIVERMFQNCSKLTSIAIPMPSRITTIERYAFLDCIVLDLNIPASVTAIGMSAFANWGSGQKIYIQGRNKTAAYEAWGTDWLRYCDAEIIYE